MAGGETYQWVDQNKVGRKRAVGGNSDPDTFVTYSKAPAYNPENEDTIENKPNIPKKEDRKTNNSQNQTSNTKIYIGIALIALVFILFYAFSKSSENMNLTETSWKRQIILQRYQWVPNEGFIVPPGGVVQSSEIRISGTNIIVDGYDEVCSEEPKTIEYEEYSHTDTKCDDSGKCTNTDIYETKSKTSMETVCKQVEMTHEEPIYEPYYFYNEWKAIELDPIESKGITGSIPFWPEYNYLLNQHTEFKNSKEIYTAKFEDEKQDYHTYTFDSEPRYYEFSQRIGNYFRVTRNSFGITDVNEVQ